jgi:hypothetical protein
VLLTNRVFCNIVVSRNLECMVPKAISAPSPQIGFQKVNSSSAHFSCKVLSSALGHGTSHTD